MAIVHMNERVERFMNQLELHDTPLNPNPEYFDYDEGKEVYKYDEDEIINLPDFEIDFGLVVTQTGVYTPGEGKCQPPEFNEESTDIEIVDLDVYDNVYGESLRLNREEFTDVINKLMELITI